MKGTEIIEERNRQKVYRIINELNQTSSAADLNPRSLDSCTQQYEETVQKLFVATVFYKGMNQACMAYKHIVKKEYRRFCKLLIQKAEDESLKERALNNLRKKRNRLLKKAPSRLKKEPGFEIFYALTGGFRKKYTPNRKSIELMYREMESASANPLHSIYYAIWCVMKYLGYFKEYTLWQLRSIRSN
ncbi:hypothetical protein IW492_12910 [Enterococcus sp. BWB1-3]|uniref:hypothetical protein n=1 Tax=unclassified Enterococcus TaxID=2608891 RepID=UPI001922B244|nr:MULTISPECIES: hypothetical protein [unclassified Enterococcus]MBL1230133.1 hypothetical protein [Enterococcus sp. BWB1-3]MCB5950965.1 hypothetical protein [Enterococcus sp. BWT-B8]